MSFDLRKIIEPELKLSDGHWLVSVPVNKSDEAVEFFLKSDAVGFSFNGALGCDQVTLDATLKKSSPSRIMIANMDGVDYASVYETSSLRSLILGYKCDWPDFSELQMLKEFVSMEPHKLLDDLPAGLVALSLYGYKEKTLANLSRLHALKTLDIKVAKEIVDIDGLPPAVNDISLSGCPRLKSIASIGSCCIKKLRLSNCKSLKNIDEIYDQKNIVSLIIENVPIDFKFERIISTGVEWIHVNGVRY
ncbi:hypothetical protein [Xanthomonas arboricola]|uniref:hypothetical protein n=1 Tax=Xanthomonas arboricola TaxID=56448 RepID=UPI00160AE464|nr:hypothetical protein [Xanthomonas arboricola]CAD7377060.1 hypothetical protein X12_000735 [Xanthomonas arboricola]CAG2084724.1 hypothetical protein XCY_000734 [Xanthomonas arboricola pv. juglandis]